MPSIKSVPNLRRSITLAGLSLALAVNATLLVLQGLSAHNYSPSFKWDYPSTDIKIEARSMSYGTQVLDGCMEYHDDTDISVDTCSINTNDGNIIHIEGNYGDTWTAYADPMTSSSDRCFNWPNGTLNGNCNETTDKAAFAYVYWNTFHYPHSSSVAHYIARHEIAHVFGLAHILDGCATSSVLMSRVVSGEVVPCATVPGNLTAHDISDINAKY